MSEKMKERIVNASIALFNEKGSHSITTNHIIDYLGISPGTFYYHFRNKEEIVRKIFSRIKGDFGAVLEAAEEESTFEGLIGKLKEMFRLYSRYSFFYREITSLLDRDRLLESEYRNNYSDKSGMMRNLFRLMEDKGILVKGFSSVPEIDSVIDSLWILCDFWTSFLGASGRLTDKAVESGYKNYLCFLRPYLEKSALEKVDSCFP